MGSLLLLLGLTLYVVVCRYLVASSRPWRDPVFALANVAAVYAVYIAPHKFQVFFLAYLALVALQFLALRFYRQKNTFPWVAFLAPLLFMVAVRYVHLSQIAKIWPAIAGDIHSSTATLTSYFIGISYLAFRTSHLVIQVRNGVVARPTFWQYFGYSFFLPTFSVGPINPYNNHQDSFGTTSAKAPVSRALLRVLIGAVKARFLAAQFNQLSYQILLLDGYPHHWIDLPIASSAYYLFLYCNFSGFCDIAIGGAGLMGIRVAENFADPFAARNVKDFWNRWHITLSLYMRDIVFSPLSKFLVRSTGPKYANHAIALTIAVVFVLVGIWHGAGGHYLAFGLAHALAVVANHYYTIGLKKWLSREAFIAYQKSRLIKWIAISMTFCYISASFFLFANTFEDMRIILRNIRW